MGDPYRADDRLARPCPEPADPGLACITYLSAMMAGGVVAPLVALLYNAYAEYQAGTTLGMMIGMNGWKIPADYLIYLAISGAGLLIGPLLMATLHGVPELWGRASMDQPRTAGPPSDARS